jgi:hypothetical protein
MQPKIWRLIYLIILVCLPLVALAGGGFSEGYKFGFRDGFRNLKGPYSIVPLSPIPPLPEIGRDSLWDGYNEGFLEGLRQARGEWR